MFLTDSQTLEDLRIFGRKKKTESIYAFYDHTATYGGSLKLENMLRHPLSNREAIHKRAEAIKFLSESGAAPPLDKEIYDFIEYYLLQKGLPQRKTALNLMTAAVRSARKTTQEQYAIRRGVPLIIGMIGSLAEFSQQNGASRPALIEEYASEISDILDNSLAKHIASFSGRKLSAARIIEYDYEFRYASRDKIRRLLDILYEMDVLASMKVVIEMEGFCFPEMTCGVEITGGNELEIAGRGGVEITGLHHPLVENAVPTDINYGSGNLCFLTGANMSGKSTFMRAFSAAVYLAHTGFPVPASRMKCPVFEGLFTTINLGDDIGLGYSHFYAEVERVRKVAETMKEHPRLMVVFDELFRGTNLKDAFDASVAILQAFGRCRDSRFLISTHITEVADRLAGVPGIIYRYFATDYSAGGFRYTYKLKEGISNERLGMEIISRAGIIELLEQCYRDKGAV